MKYLTVISTQMVEKTLTPHYEHRAIIVVVK